MNIIKTNYTNNEGYFNAGVALESEIHQVFSDFTKASSIEDSNGVDGYCTIHGVKCAVQLKCAVHPNGANNPSAGYSVAHNTTQRKLTACDYLIIALPEVIAYNPVYTLNHELSIVYVVQRAQAVKRKLFAYNSKGEMYFPKRSRLVLDRMIKDGYAEPVDILTIT